MLERIAIEVSSEDQEQDKQLLPDVVQIQAHIPHCKKM